MPGELCRPLHQFLVQARAAPLNPPTRPRSSHLTARLAYPTILALSPPPAFRFQPTPERPSLEIMYIEETCSIAQTNAACAACLHKNMLLFGVHARVQLTRRTRLLRCCPLSSMSTGRPHVVTVACVTLDSKSMLVPVGTSCIHRQGSGGKLWNRMMDVMDSGVVAISCSYERAIGLNGPFPQLVFLLLHAWRR